MKRDDYVLILHNIRSTHNVGSIFRTADAAGVSKVYLTGYTPAPRDRFKRIQSNIAKTALGAEETVTWEQGELAAVRRKLKNAGFTIISVEQDKRATPLAEFVPRPKTAFIFGNEVRGVSKQVRDSSDEIVEIPMLGTKESLNVSVSVGIVLFHSRAMGTSS